MAMCVCGQDVCVCQEGAVSVGGFDFELDRTSPAAQAAEEAEKIRAAAVLGASGVKLEGAEGVKYLGGGVQKIEGKNAYTANGQKIKLGKREMKALKTDGIVELDQGTEALRHKFSEEDKKAHEETRLTAPALATDDKKRKLQITRRDDMGRTELHRAALEGKPTYVQQLLQSGADKDAKDNAGKTPLHLACTMQPDANKNKKQQAEYNKAKGGTVVALCRVQASFNERDNYGRTALHVGFTGKEPIHHRIVKQLLNLNGSDVNVQDDKGYTPLHFAAQMSEAAVKNLLNLRDTRVDIKNDNGETPFDLACNRAVEEALKARYYEDNPDTMDTAAFESKFSDEALAAGATAAAAAREGQERSYPSFTPPSAALIVPKEEREEEPRGDYVLQKYLETQQRSQSLRVQQHSPGNAQASRASSEIESILDLDAIVAHTLEALPPGFVKVRDPRMGESRWGCRTFEEALDFLHKVKDITTVSADIRKKGHELSTDRQHHVPDGGECIAAGPATSDSFGEPLLDTSPHEVADVGATPLVAKRQRERLEDAADAGTGLADAGPVVRAKRTKAARKSVANPRTSTLNLTSARNLARASQPNLAEKVRGRTDLYTNDANGNGNGAGGHSSTDDERAEVTRVSVPSRRKKAKPKQLTVSSFEGGNLKTPALDAYDADLLKD